ncbi:Acid phosphatase [Oopsacas minuta]|uniref:Acid phosphatase n=1 Tax=Oopsacas minuta TaxID=111878 RepID=A0AAV7JS37_9METZ|nr:Acid phosphatase [Oopsacas minuta]
MKEERKMKKCTCSLKSCIFIFCCCFNIISAVCLCFFIYHCFILLIFTLDAYGGSTSTCRSYFVSADNYKYTSNISNPLSTNNASNISGGRYRMNEARTIGLHNSYHIMNSLFSQTSWAAYMFVFVSAWSYTHPSLTGQLEQGYRVFEIDIHARDDALMVYHIQLFDQLTTCYCLSECINEINSWSDANPWHFPIILEFEYKYYWYEDAYIYQGNKIQFKHILALEQELINVFGGKLVTPQLLRGKYSTLLEAINVTKWPIIDQVRGRVFAVMWDDTELLDIYLEGDRADEPVLFTLYTSDNELNGVFDKSGNPVGKQEIINSSVETGRILRTRVDSRLEYNPERRNVGLNSKAQLLITDLLDRPLFEDLKNHCYVLTDFSEYVCIG